MSGRPEVLFPLFASLETLPGVGEKTAKALGHLHIEAPRDLLFTLPTSGIDRRFRPTIKGVTLPATVTTEVTVERHHPPRAKGRPTRIDVSDAETSFSLVFFHARADWLQRQLPEGAKRVVSGKVEVFDGVAQMPHPDHILAPDEAGDLPSFEPVYPLTQSVTLKTMTNAAAASVARAPDLEEWIDPSRVEREGWPDWKTAISAALSAEGCAVMVMTAAARKRMAYDVLFAHQVTIALARSRTRHRKGRA